jgi:cytoskeletal protein CcmA (bactofilin family)
LLFGVIAALLLAASALAAVIVTATPLPSDKVLAGDEVTIPAGTTIDHDVYIFGTSATVAGTVQGDVVVAAGRVVIDGTVTGDVLAAASDTTVGPAGRVAGDLRVATGELTIGGQVGEDVATVATSIDVAAGARVGGDMLFNASSVNVSGAVAGGISGSSSDYRRDGTVGGPEDVSQTAGADQAPTDRTVGLALDAIRQYIVVLLIGLTLLWIAPRFMRAAADRARTQPLQSAGIGVVVVLGYLGLVVALIVAMVLVAVVFGRLDFVGFVALDIVGSLLAGAGLTFGLILFSAFIADAIVGLAIGRLVALAEPNRWEGIIRLASGAAIVVIATSFPEIGGVIKVLVVLIGLGAVAIHLWEGRRQPVTGSASPATTVS